MAKGFVAGAVWGLVVSAAGAAAVSLAVGVAPIVDAPPAPEQGEALWPGEGSVRRREEYLEKGILLPGQLVAELEKLAVELAITLRWA